MNNDSGKENFIEYTSIKIPKVFANKIITSEIYKSMCFRSVSEFMMDSARRRIEHERQ